MSVLSIELCGNLKEYRKQEGKQYRIENAEKIAEKCLCQCGSETQKKNMYRHIKTIKHQQYLQSLNN